MMYAMYVMDTLNYHFNFISKFFNPKSHYLKSLEYYEWKNFDASLDFTP